MRKREKEKAGEEAEEEERVGVQENGKAREVERAVLLFRQAVQLALQTESRSVSDITMQTSNAANPIASLMFVVDASASIPSTRAQANGRPHLVERHKGAELD